MLSADKVTPITPYVRRMNTLTLSPQGLDIKNRKYHLRTYKDCFVGTRPSGVLPFFAVYHDVDVGSEAVTWLLQKQKVIPLKTREEAVELGQLLIDRGVIHHVVNRQPFKDGYFFYRFYVVRSPTICHFSASGDQLTLFSTKKSTRRSRTRPRPRVLCPLRIVRFVRAVD